MSRLRCSKTYLLGRGTVVVLALAAVTLFWTACVQQGQGGPAPTVGAPATAAPKAPATTPPSPAAVATPTTGPGASPTSTGAALAQCTVSPVRAFGRVYSENPNVARALGCAREPEKQAQMAEQPFQKGFMYWRSDTRQIYVVMNTGRWAAYPDTWNEGDPNPLVGGTPPAGALEPTRGFGKVWREQSGVRDSLGWATVQERGFNGVVEPFANGTMLWTDQRVVFVLFSDGTWLRFADVS